MRQVSFSEVEHIGTKSDRSSRSNGRGAVPSHNRPVFPRIAAAVLAIGAIVTIGMSQSDPMLERAKRLLKEVPVIDGHNDYPWAVHEKAGGDPEKLDIRRPQPSIMTGLPRPAP